MPAVAAVDKATILEAIQKFPVYDKNGKLEPEGSRLWKYIVKYLKNRIKLHNLRETIRKNPAFFKQRIEENVQSIQNPDITREEKEDDSNQMVDQFDSIHELAIKDSEFSTCIKSISIKPFSIIYQLPEQIQLSKDIKKKTTSTGLILVIASTLKKVKVNKYISGDIFIIIYAVKCEDIIVNLWQCITENLSHSFLTSFFMKFIKESEFSDEVVLAYSKSLLNAVSSVCNSCDFLSLNVIYYKYLFGKEKYLPPLLIKIDISSILFLMDKFIAKMPNTMSELKKQFFKKIFIYMSEITDFNELKNIIIEFMILTICPNECELTSNIEKKFQIMIEEEEILKKFSYYDSIGIENFLFSHIKNEEFSIADPGYLINDFVESIKAIAIDASKFPHNLTDSPNVYYFKNFCDEFFVILLQFFPTWSNLLHQGEDFHLLAKSTEKQLSIMMENKDVHSTATNFIVNHLEKTRNITSKCRLLLSSLKTKQHISNYNLKKSDHTSLNYEENWMGKNREANTKTEKNKLLEGEGDLEDVFIESNDIEFSSSDSDGNGDDQEDTAQNKKDPDFNIFQYKIKKNTTKYNDYTKKANTNTNTDNNGEINNNNVVKASDENNSSNSFPLQIAPSTCNDSGPQHTSNSFPLQIAPSTCNDSGPQHTSNSFPLQIASLICNNSGPQNFSTPVKSSLSIDHVFEDLISFNDEQENYEIIKEFTVGQTHSVAVDFLEPSVKKKKGIYVQPTDIVIPHQQAVSKNQRGPKEIFLKNGCLLQPRRINKTSYVLRDTSIVDSVSEIFLFCAKNINKYLEIISAERCLCSNFTSLYNDCFLKLIVNLCNGSSVENYYKARFKFLFKFGKITDDNISNSKKCSELYENLLDSHCSLIESIDCNLCSKSMENKRYLIKIYEGKKFLNFQEFNVEIKKSVFKHRFCIDCNSLISPTYIFGNFFLIDLEHGNFVVSISFVPCQITVNNLTYFLYGIVAYETQLNNNISYIAYIKTAQNQWFKKQSSQKTSKPKSVLNPEVKPAVLVYIKVLV